jgi:hypothetical protein
MDALCSPKRRFELEPHDAESQKTSIIVRRTEVHFSLPLYSLLRDV